MKRYSERYKRSWRGWEYTNERACNKGWRTHEAVRQRSCSKRLELERAPRVDLWISGPQWSRQNINDQNAPGVDEAEFWLSACLGNGYTHGTIADSAAHCVCEREKDTAAVAYSRRPCPIQSGVLSNVVSQSSRKIYTP